MPQLDKHSFAAARKVEQVEVPELGGSVWFKELSAKDLHGFRVQFADQNPDAFFDFEYALLSRVLVHEDGSPLFASVEELRELSDLTVSLLQRLAKQALEFCGLSRPNA